MRSTPMKPISNVSFQTSKGMGFSPNISKKSLLDNLFLKTGFKKSYSFCRMDIPFHKNGSLLRLNPSQIHRIYRKGFLLKSHPIPKFQRRQIKNYSSYSYSSSSESSYSSYSFSSFGKMTSPSVTGSPFSFKKPSR